MTWYYVRNGEPAGPISDEELLSKLRLGSILPTTMLWRSGMAQWQPASEVTRTLQPAPPVSSFSSGSSVGLDVPPELTSGPPPVLPHFFCTYCGNIIPADQLVHISGRAVCATCKPAYVQQVREGLNAPIKAPVLRGFAVSALPAQPESDLADPWLRLVAYLLDWVFVMVPLVIGWFLFFFFVLGSVMSRAGGASPTPAMATGFIFILSMLLAFGWIFFYWTFFIGRRGFTFGMQIMKLEMVRADRSPVTYARAFSRAVALYIINAFTMGLTNITAFFDSENRTVVDMICDTRVVRMDVVQS
jgi:uncharacterized RDD family membrane protein YckC